MFQNLVNKYVTCKNIMFTVVFLIFMFLIVSMQDVAIMFFASFVIACSLNQIVDKMLPRFSRPTASLIVLGVTLLLVAIVFVPLIVLAGNEIKTFADSFPQYIDNIISFIQSSSIIKKSDLLKLDFGALISPATDFTTRFVNEAVGLGKNLGSAFVYLLASVIIIYYYMADKEVIENTFIKLFPIPMREKAKSVLDIIAKKIGGYVTGQITAMAGVGVVMTVGLLILRVDYAVLLGLITAILDIVPIVGPGIALVICIIAAYKAGPVTLLMIVVVFSIAQLSENNLVKPYVFGKLLNLHPIIIYLFLFITAKYMSVIGVIFAPAIAATFCVLVEELYMKSLEEADAPIVEVTENAE